MQYIYFSKDIALSISPAIIHYQLSFQEASLYTTKKDISGFSKNTSGLLQTRPVDGNFAGLADVLLPPCCDYQHCLEQADRSLTLPPCTLYDNPEQSSHLPATLFRSLPDTIPSQNHDLNFCAPFPHADQMALHLHGIYALHACMSGPSRQPHYAIELAVQSEGTQHRATGSFRNGNTCQLTALPGSIQRVPPLFQCRKTGGFLRVDLSNVLHMRKVLAHREKTAPSRQAVTRNRIPVVVSDPKSNAIWPTRFAPSTEDKRAQTQGESNHIRQLLRESEFYIERDKYKETEVPLQEALKLVQHSTNGQNKKEHVLALLGFLRLEQGMYEQALTLYEDALGLAYHQADQKLIDSILPAIAVVYFSLGDAATALLFLPQMNQQPVLSRKTTSQQTAQELISSLLLLYQQRYDEAYRCLLEIEKVVCAAGMERRILATRLRLAACQLARNQNAAAHHLLAEVTALLKKHRHYKQSALVELQRLPALLKQIKCLPQLAQLRAFLSLEGEIIQETVGVSLVTSTTHALGHPPRLSVQGFGEPTILLDGQPIKHWRTARALELFFFLLNTNQPVSKERIIHALWPHADQQIRQTFHVTIHHLRKTLGAPVLVFQDGCYYLDLAVEYGEQIWYDVLVFQTYDTQARLALARADDVSARIALTQMVALYHGDYGRPFYNHWCSIQRDKLRTTYQEALSQLARIAWRQHAVAECAEYWRHVLRIDNCQEEAHLGLMQCYAQQGKRSLALRQYQECYATLQQELGIEPEAPIQLFYQSLTNALTSVP